MVKQKHHPTCGLTLRIRHQTSHIRHSSAFRGFTLIELLVVISLIALLIALMLPALGAAKAQARVSVCASNQRQTAIALVSYAMQYGEYPTETTWDAEAAAPVHEGVAGSASVFNNLLVGKGFITATAAQCSETKPYADATSFDEFYDKAWFRYSGPSSVGYWVWHYGHGGMLLYYGWHNASSLPISSTRGPSFRKQSVRPANTHPSQAFGSCPRSLICLSDWSYARAYEAHLNRPIVATTGLECQFDNINTTRLRNYYFLDGHVEFIKN